MTTMKPTRAQTAAGCVAALVLLASPQPGRTSPLVETLGLPSLESLTATVERPLFMRSRRPPAEAAPEPEEEEKPVVVAKEEAPGELTGIVMGPERTYALLTRRESQETELLRQGQTIDQWNVEEIGPRHVLLRRGAGQIRLELFDEKEQKPSSRRPADARTNFRGRPSQANQRKASTRQAQRRPQPRRPTRPRANDDDDD